MQGPTGRQRVALGLGGMVVAAVIGLLAFPPVVSWLGQWGRTPLGDGLFLEEGVSDLRLRHLGGVPLRVEVRAGADEGVALLPGPALFGLFGACRPEEGGQAAILAPGGACRLVWSPPDAGPQALGFWWRTGPGPWRPTLASRRFSTDAGMLWARPDAEGGVRLRLSAARAPAPLLGDGRALFHWRCASGACEGALGPAASGWRLRASWLPAAGVDLRGVAAGGLRWGEASGWDARGRATAVVENISTVVQARPLPLLFGAEAEELCLGPLAPGDACVLHLRRTGDGPAAVALEGAGVLALTPGHQGRSIRAP
jgi:hypothetical protein